MRPDAGAAAGFGRHLKRERELRGLSREEVARRIRLAPEVVEAIESGDVERIPPRAYLLGILRGYAEAAGLDPDEVVLRWQEVEGDAASAAAPRRRVPRRLLVAAGAAVLLAAALALLHAFGRPAAPDRERRRGPAGGDAPGPGAPPGDR